MRLFLWLIFIVGFPQAPSESRSTFLPNNPSIHYTGRIDFKDPQKPRLSGAGCCLQFQFIGPECTIFLRDQGLNGNHGYLAIVIDGQYQRRIRTSRDQSRYVIAKNLPRIRHSVVICKATESQNGYIEFIGISCEKIIPPEKVPRRRIEFIGNSITCGMGLDQSQLPCGQGEWYDQTNAWLAFGPITARRLDAEWLLSAVSGIGLTRNWNGESPTMPQVYRNTYLNTDSTSIWAATAFVPDLIAISLGTNDFSAGDGSYLRTPLDSTHFVGEYIRFIKMLRSRYPAAQLVCLSSPVLEAGKNNRLIVYLQAVVEHFRAVEMDARIARFTFSRIYNMGCSGHPDREDHELMAGELAPFLKSLMGW
jgi:hypothetical protein